MTFKPAIWTPIAALLALGNVAFIWIAAQATEPLHATVHAGVALAFGVWAQRLHHRSRSRLESGAELEELGGEVDGLRRELSEAQERLDFAERILAQQSRPKEEVDRTGR